MAIFSCYIFFFKAFGTFCSIFKIFGNFHFFHQTETTGKPRFDTESNILANRSNIGNIVMCTSMPSVKALVGAEIGNLSWLHSLYRTFREMFMKVDSKFTDLEQFFEHQLKSENFNLF